MTDSCGTVRFSVNSAVSNDTSKERQTTLMICIKHLDFPPFTGNHCCSKTVNSVVWQAIRFQRNFFMLLNCRIEFALMDHVTQACTTSLVSSYHCGIGNITKLCR